MVIFGGVRGKVDNWHYRLEGYDDGKRISDLIQRD